MLMGDGTNENYKGTYLPLNITNQIDGTFYKSDSIKPEEVVATNTGYLTGGGSSSTNATAWLRNQKTNKDSQGIRESIASFSNNRDIMFSGSNFSFAYYDGKTRNHYRLIDEESGLIRADKIDEISTHIADEFDTLLSLKDFNEKIINFLYITI